MAYYVYQYLHPEYGHLYCGRADNLDTRIYQHNNLENDNIPREYETLLKESVVMYVELQNKAQGVAVEAYCIDKFKPFINKALKYDTEEESVLEMKLPEWKIYNVEKSKKKLKLNSLEDEMKAIDDTIFSVENKIKSKKELLEKRRDICKKIEYEIKINQEVSNKNSLFALCLDDIKWFYKHCENKNVRFYSEIYDKLGRLAISGVIYYDSDINQLVLKIDDSTPVKESSLVFEVLANSLYNFYPDIDIYPELYAALSVEKQKLKIANNIYDINTLLKNTNTKNKSIWFRSIDGNICVLFKNNKIVDCDVNYHGEKYSWNLESGREIIKENRYISVKEDLDSNIKKYIYSAKYFSPDRDCKTEEYCDAMLLKYTA